MSRPVVFRPRGGVVLAAVAIAICAVALIWLLVTDGFGGLLLWSWPIVAFAWLAYALYIRPCVIVTDGFVEIRNPLRSHRVPWGDVDRVESRYALTVRTHSGTVIRAWAAPAPGARQALSTRREDVRNTFGDDETRRPSDALGTQSGDATAIVMRHLDAFARSGEPARPGGTTTTWAVLPAVVTVALLGAAVYSLVQLSSHG